MDPSYFENHFVQQYGRVKWFSQDRKFYLLCEACVNRKYDAFVDELDESLVHLRIVIPAPDDVVFASLFELQAAHVSPFEDAKQETELKIYADRKLKKHGNTSSAWPSNEAPLWYGFIFIYDDAPSSHVLRESDATSLFLPKKRKRDEVEEIPVELDERSDSIRSELEKNNVDNVENVEEEINKH